MPLKKKREEIIDLGFGQKESVRGQRIINKDGSFNIRKKGIPFLESFNFYHYLVTISWTRFILIVFTGYVVINLLFALIYYLIGAENLNGVTATDGFGKFLTMFFFSTQTFTTVGYGNLSPAGVGSNTVAALESLIGFLALALATGLLYGRFSRPIARLQFSKHSIIAPFSGMKAYQFRVANKQRSQMINVNVTVMLTILENTDGTSVRKYYNLKLEYPQINMFPTVWTVNHPIDENSPMFGMTHDTLMKGEAEIMILLKGYDDTFSQDVHTRFSYRADEIVWGAKFVNIFGQEDDGTPTIAVDRIDEYATAELPDGIPKLKND
jgi:inward rectifier potassium channel